MKKKKPSSSSPADEFTAAVDDDNDARRRRRRRRHDELELLKAAAQAWYSHSGIKYSNPTTSEHDAHRRNFHGHRPSRFRVEAAVKGSGSPGGRGWDFRQSLLDSHELVAVSKKLESRGIGLDDEQFGSRLDENVDDDDDPAAAAGGGGGRVRRKVERESRSSLRNLLSRIFL